MESKFLNIKKILSASLQYFNKNTLQKIIFFSGGTIIFIVGVILYGTEDRGNRGRPRVQRMDNTGQ